jgi:iron complex outermembrane receptor protein
MSLLCALLGTLCAPVLRAQSNLDLPPASSIGSMPLAHALELFARKTGLQLVYVSEAVQGVVSKGAPAGLTPRETLNRLLEGTGVTFEFLNERTVRIFPITRTVPNKPIATNNPTSTDIPSGERADTSGDSDHQSTHYNTTDENRGDKAMTGKRNLLARIAGLFAVCGAAAHPDGACAQAVPGDQASSTAELQEITVTARRVEENLQDVPVTVSVVTSEMLASNPINNQWDLQSYVPGLTVSMSSGTSGSGSLSNANYALRGLRTAGVVTYFDDVPTAPTTSRELYDMSSIQVLEGPQGTLFGKNTTAGAILFAPNLPSDQTLANFQYSGGNYNLEAVQGMINLPIIEDKLMVRLAAELYERDGWEKVEPVTTPTGVLSVYGSLAAQGSDHHNSFRLSILAKPIEGLENLTIFDWFGADEAPETGQQIVSVPCPAHPSIAQQFVFAPCLYEPPLTTLNGLPTWSQEFAAGLAVGPRATVDPSQNRNYQHTWQLIDRTTYQLTDHLTVKNIFGLVNTYTNDAFDADATIFPAIGTDLVNLAETLSDETQVQGKYGRLQFTVGNFYSNLLNSVGHTGANVGLLGPNPSNPVVSTTLATNDNEAIYGQATYAILPRLDLTAGARYTWIRKGQMQSAFLGPILPGTDHGPCEYNKSTLYVNLATCTQTLGPASFDEPTYDASIDYKVTDKVLTYLTVSDGFDEGGFNGANSDFPTYAPEKLLDFEPGVKADWTLLGRPIRTDVDVYYSKFTDIQRSVLRVNPQGIGVGGTINAAGASVFGTQVKIDLFLTDHLELIANTNTTHAYYTTFNYEPAVGGGFVSLEGNELALAPKFTANAAATYHLPIPNIAKDLSATVNYSYQGREVTTDVNPSNALISNALDPYSTIAGYGLINLQINWRGILESPADVSVFITNLTDKLYRTGIVNTVNSYGFAVAYYGNPMMFGASLRYHFN